MASSDNRGDPNASKPGVAQAPAGPQRAEIGGHEIPAPPRTRWFEARLMSRMLDAGVLLLVGLACAYLLTPGLYTQRIPYGEESLGQFSEMVIKASRDFDIPDEETTRRKRDEAREAVLPVYDYDLTVGESAINRVKVAFTLMRQARAEVEQRFEPIEPPEPKGEKRPGSKRKEAPDPLEAQREAAVAQAYQEKRGEWQRRLEAQLDDATFQQFAAAHFSEEVERQAATLIARAIGHERLVAEYKDQLLAGGRAVTVRRRSGSQIVGERQLEDVSGIPDQSEVRGEVDRFLADLPEEWTPALRRAVVALVSRQVRANLRFNREETEERRRLSAESVKPVVIQLKKGERIIGDGERIERRHLTIFSAIRAQSREEDRVQGRLGGALFAIILLSAVFGFARASLRRFRPTRKDALFGALCIVGMLALVNVSVTVSDALHERFGVLAAEAYYFAIPFAAGAMLMRFVLASEPAVVYAVGFAGLVGVLFGNSLQFGIYTLVGGLVAAWRVARANDRAALFRAGVHTGLANAALVIAFALLENELSMATGLAAVAGFFGGAVLVPILVMGVTPLIESAFGYTTDIKLLELANLNHPALKELIVQAPGTYHHSIIMGSLVEAAAEAIGANPLLARVCAYYHDIGKGRNPLYFGENQKGENRHDKLPPQMSAMIIKRHVLDGIEMAKHYKLPKQVADAIPQHHGTRLVGFFFHKALKEQEGKENPEPVDDSPFRYPGPKPQFREAALVMIADAVEASSRAMQDPTPAKLQALVQKIINGIFADGQLDECDLTLKDLNEIARVFHRTLGGIYHTRPEYPPQAMGGMRPPAQLVEVRDGRGGERKAGS